MSAALAVAGSLSLIIMGLILLFAPNEPKDKPLVTNETADHWSDHGIVEPRKEKAI